MSSQDRTNSAGASLRLATAVRDERGSELVEAALVIPLVFMFLIGLVSLGRAFSVQQAMTRAAREGARAIVLTSCGTCGSSMYTASYVQTNYVNPSLVGANLDPTNATYVSSYATTYVYLDPSDPTPYQCGVRISFNYPFQLVVPLTSLNLTTINLSAVAQMRLENQPTACSGAVP